MTISIGWKICDVRTRRDDLLAGHTQRSFRVAIRNQDMPIDVSRNQRDRRDGHDDLCLGIHAAKPVNEGEEIGDTSDARMLRNS
jgi:hypothetical protein